MVAASPFVDYRVGVFDSGGVCFVAAFECASGFGCCASFFVDAVKCFAEEYEFADCFACAFREWFLVVDVRRPVPVEVAVDVGVVACVRVDVHGGFLPLAVGADGAVFVAVFAAAFGASSAVAVVWFVAVDYHVSR